MEEGYENVKGWLGKFILKGFKIMVWIDHDFRSNAYKANFSPKTL